MNADWSVTLNDAQLHDLLDKLAALKTTDQADCGADAPSERLTVYDQAGAGRFYQGSFYAGCDTVSDAGATGLIDFHGTEARALTLFLQSLKPAPDGG